MDYLKSIADDTREQMLADVQAHLNRAHFTVTFIALLKPICEKWGERVMNARFINTVLTPEVRQMLDGISGAAHRAKLEYWYISGDKHQPISMRDDVPAEYVVSINLRYTGDKWTKAGRPHQTALGDFRLELRFPGLKYSDEAFNASTDREVAAASATVRLMADVVLDPAKIDRLVEGYNSALETLKEVCGDEYAKCFPLSHYFRSGQI